MQFHIETRGITPDLVAINDAISAIDPAAVVDIDPVSAQLRVSAELSAHELLGTLAQAGYPIGHGQLRPLPSICCGDCSG